MIIIGLDPSFKRTGIAKVSIEDRVIELKDCSVPLSQDEKTFKHVYTCALMQVEQIVREIPEDGIVISEEPIPSSMFSAGLFCLDSMLFQRLGPHLKATTHPSYLLHLLGKSRTKTDSVNKVKEILTLFEKRGYKVIKKGRISHDACEAFLISLKLMKDLGKLPEDVYQLLPKLKDAKSRTW